MVGRGRDPIKEEGDQLRAGVGFFSLSLQAGLCTFLSGFCPSVHLPLHTPLAQPRSMTFPTALKSLIWSLGFLLLSLGFFDSLGLTDTEQCALCDLGPGVLWGLAVP